MVFASKVGFLLLFCLTIKFFIKKFGFFLVVIEKSCTFVLSLKDSTTNFINSKKNKYYEKDIKRRN